LKAWKIPKSQETAMSETAAANRTPLLIALGVVGLAIAGTVALWAHYGTAVFFEVIRAGFVACFG
jgi:hypothetical protein